MSTIISSMISRPSRIHNVAYILFGFAIASAVVPISEIANLSDYLLIIAIIGGFVGTLLFYIKPVEGIQLLILRIFLKLEKTYGDSPFLTETKGKIIAGSYFFFACLITMFNSNLQGIIVKGPLWLSYFIPLAGIIVFVMSIYEAFKLPQKVMILNHYYSFAGDRLTPLMSQLKGALERRDWIEAELLYHRGKYGTRLSK